MKTIYKLFYIHLLVLLIYFHNNTFAQKPNLEGFREIKWGWSEEQVDRIYPKKYKQPVTTQKEKIQDKLLSSLFGYNKLPSEYEILPRIESYGGTSDIKNSYFTYYQNMLCRVVIIINDFTFRNYNNKIMNPELLNTLVSDLNEKYFKGIKEDEDTYRWIFNDGNYILITRDTNVLIISYVNKLLDQKYWIANSKKEQELKEKEKAERLKDY